MSSLFVAGISGNSNGRPKYSVRSIKGMVERFVRRNLSPNKLQKMYGNLSTKDQIDMLLQLLPYAIAKQTNEGISREEVDKLYDMIQEGLKKNHGKAV